MIAAEHLWKGDYARCVDGRIRKLLPEEPKEAAEMIVGDHHIFLGDIVVIVNHLDHLGVIVSRGSPLIG